MIIEDSSSDNDDFQMVPTITKPKAPRKRTKRSNASFGTLSQQNWSDPSTEVPKDATTRTPKIPSMWNVDGRWSSDVSFHKERELLTQPIISSCDSIIRWMDAHKSLNTDDKSHLYKLCHTIIRHTMAIDDRITVEQECLQNVAKEEIYDARERFINLVNEVNTCDTSFEKRQSAMKNILDIQQSMRGIYPHISYSHTHNHLMPLEVHDEY